MPAKAKVRAKGAVHRSLCEQWKARREELGLSQADVAEQLGVKQPTYCEIESGRKVPTVDQAERVSQALKLRMPSKLAPA